MDAISGLFGQVGAFIKRPFSSDARDGSLMNWALFTILIATIAVLWLHVLRHITEEV